MPTDDMEMGPGTLEVRLFGTSNQLRRIVAFVEERGGASDVRLRRDKTGFVGRVYTIRRGRELARLLRRVFATDVRRATVKPPAMPSSLRSATG